MLAPLHHAALVLLHISRTDEVAKPNFVPGSPLHLEGEYRRLRVMVDFVRNYEMKIGNWGCLIAPLSRANLCNRCFRIPFRSMINVSPFSFFLDTSSPDVLSFLYIFHHILHHARVHASHLISEKYESLGRITFTRLFTFFIALSTARARHYSYSFLSFLSYFSSHCPLIAQHSVFNVIFKMIPIRIYRNTFFQNPHKRGFKSVKRGWKWWPKHVSPWFDDKSILHHISISLNICNVTYFSFYFIWSQWRFKKKKNSFHFALFISRE